MSEIVGVGPATTVLESLLSSIEVSLQAAQGFPVLERMRAVEAAKTRLGKFADSTRAQNLADPAEVKAIRDIDDLVLEIISALTVQEAQLGAGALQAGAERLRGLTSALNVQTKTTVGAAKSISLQPVKKAVDTMTAMVNSVKSLKSNLSSADPDEAKVITEIEKLVDQFETLRQAVTAGA